MVTIRNREELLEAEKARINRLIGEYHREVRDLKEKLSCSNQDRAQVEPWTKRAKQLQRLNDLEVRLLPWAYQRIQDIQDGSVKYSSGRLLFFSGRREPSGLILPVA